MTFNLVSPLCNGPSPQSSQLHPVIQVLLKADYGAQAGLECVIVLPLRLFELIFSISF